MEKSSRSLSRAVARAKACSDSFLKQTWLVVVKISMSTRKRSPGCPPDREHADSIESLEVSSISCRLRQRRDNSGELLTTKAMRCLIGTKHHIGHIWQVYECSFAGGLGLLLSLDQRCNSVATHALIPTTHRLLVKQRSENHRKHHFEQPKVST